LEPSIPSIYPISITGFQEESRWKNMIIGVVVLVAIGAAVAIGVLIGNAGPGVTTSNPSYELDTTQFSIVESNAPSESLRPSMSPSLAPSFPPTRPKVSTLKDHMRVRMLVSVVRLGLITTSIVACMLTVLFFKQSPTPKCSRSLH
jgi:hypothetical protein